MALLFASSLRSLGAGLRRPLGLTTTVLYSIGPRNSRSLGTNNLLLPNVRRSFSPSTLRPRTFSPRQPRQARNPASKRFNSTSNSTPPPLPPPPPEPPVGSLSLSARLKKLSKEYGKAALGVYLLLSALDFPFCFLAVRMLGTERIGHWEERVLRWVKGVMPEWTKGAKQEVLAVEVVEEEEEEEEGMSDLEEAEKEARKEGASIWTELALAYAIHKSFIFIRVPLTAAVTPKVVKVLRGWGWDIGKKRGIRDSAAVARAKRAKD